MFLSISIHFMYPFLLLLLIPFLALDIIPYFTINKKYRKTRNRIVSMVLYGLVAALAVLILAGTTFRSSKSNPNNEIILLVDLSDTEEQSSTARDNFVKNAINQCKYDDIKVGIVTFGFDQEYAVELTREYDKVYSMYQNAPEPDRSATNIAGALEYTKNLFTNPDTSKIILVTDGKETDENARSIIRNIVASGLKIDTVNIPSTYDGNETQINNVTFPDYHVNKGEEFNIDLEIYSNYSKNATIELYDNGIKNVESSVDCSIIEGNQNIQFKHIFAEDGLHEITFKILDDSDVVINNNEYSSYLFVESFNKILVLEQHSGESDLLRAILTENNEFNVTVLNVKTDELPKTALELCAYDEIILNNIANSDIESSFVEILHEYVYSYGGGLFTTGGMDATDPSLAHSYSRTDMVGTLYQQMLPVQIIDYTPPVGVIFIIDRSGSMDTTLDDGSTYLEWARAGVTSCLNSLTERDYIGIMTLESDYNVILELTPRTQDLKIRSAINSIDKASGGTSFSGAIENAGMALRSLKSVDKKHIIIVSDGYVTEGDTASYELDAKTFYETDGITISVIGVNMKTPADASEYIDKEPSEIPTNSAYYKMLRLTKIGHGILHAVPANESSRLVPEMREDLQAPSIKEVSNEPFYPIVVNSAASIFTGIERLNDENHANTMSVELDGFYGAKVRSNASLLLSGEYNVPIYTQWKYGNGMVGSFMCDVYGNYSSSFMNDPNGQLFIKNVIKNLTPVENIRSNDVRLSLYEKNYSNSLSILTELKEGEYLTGSITYTDGASKIEVPLTQVQEDMSKETLRNLNAYVLVAITKDNNYSRSKFIIRKPGTYTIKIEKCNQAGEVVGSNTIHKSIAYSEEYNVLADDATNYEDVLKTFAMYGNGSYIEDLEDPNITESFETVVYREFDPRYLFAIIAIVLFLLDVAVRKFKFRWPHEIIKKYLRDKKGR